MQTAQSPSSSIGYRDEGLARGDGQSWDIQRTRLAAWESQLDGPIVVGNRHQFERDNSARA